MSKKEKLIIFILNTLLCIAAMVFTVTMMDGWGVFVLIICYAVPSICLAVGIVSFTLNKHAIEKSCFVVMVCAFIIIVTISVISKTARLGNYESDTEKIERLTEIIRNTGKWGMIVYVFIQILQVVILPLPAVVCYVPGSQIWGAGMATLLASIGVLIGSVIAYSIGRFFGKKAVIWIAGKEVTDKYITYIGNKGKVIFVLMQVLPFFPDDILCMIAGLTSMSFPYFLAVMILVRPLIIAAYCYLGNGSIIPFSGWGIPVWIAIFAVCIILAALSFKYQDRVEKWLVAKFKRNKDKPEDEENEVE
ncbi:MAG: VTT domain-containing protein [Clostridia bacterium]|nr:VTT domain-containing protein [Clostridia bacterium]